MVVHHCCHCCHCQLRGRVLGLREIVRVLGILIFRLALDVGKMIWPASCCFLAGAFRIENQEVSAQMPTSLQFRIWIDVLL